MINSASVSVALPVPLGDGGRGQAGRVLMRLFKERVFLGLGNSKQCTGSGWQQERPGSLDIARQEVHDALHSHICL